MFPNTWAFITGSFKYLPEHLEKVLILGMKNYELISRNRVSPEM
jgi:hypothetical protein